MSWARLDDEILDNDKIARAGALGLLLHVAGITWCARNLTDGRIPKQKVQCLLNLTGIYVDRGNDAGVPFTTATGNGAIDHPMAEQIALHLKGQELWHDRGDHWEIHDYLEYNPSREEVLSRREHARTKKHRQRSRPLGTPAECPPGTTGGSPPVSLAAVPAHPVPVPVPDSKREKINTRTKRNGGGWFVVPEGETLTADRRGMAIKGGLAPAAVQETWGEFEDYEFRRARHDVDRAWRNWIRKAAKRQNDLATLKGFGQSFGARRA